MERRYGPSYSSESGCFNSYWGYNSEELAQYACVVIVLAIYIGTLIALCVVRKRAGAGRHLIGLPYMFALSFMFIEQVIIFLSITLRACGVDRSMDSFYGWNTAHVVFYGLDTFLLLFVVIYTLNTMLRKQLGHNPSALKIAYGLDLFVLGALLLSYVVLLSYIYYSTVRMHRMEPVDLRIDYMSPTYVGLAFDAAHMISILASGALSLLTARSLKKKHVASNSLVVWISVLILLLFVYALVTIIQTSSQISSYGYLEGISYLAIYWIASFCRVLAFITIIVIAKNPGWRSNSFAAGP